MVCFLMREFASLCGVSTGLMFCHFSGRAARQLCAAAPRTTLCLGAAFHVYARCFSTPPTDWLCVLHSVSHNLRSEDLGVWR